MRNVDIMGWVVLVCVVGMLLLGGCGEVSVNAGLDQSAEEGSTVTLSATSIATTGLTVGYQWVQTLGPEVTLINGNSATATFTAPTVTQNTQLEFQVTASALSGNINNPLSNIPLTDSDTVTITISSNPEPTANAGIDSTVTEGATVTLTGQGNIDAESVTLEYQWSQISGTTVQLNNANASNATFLAPTVTQDAELVFELTVTAEEGNDAADEVIITVTPESPVANAGSDQIATETLEVQLDGSASTDPDNGSLSYLWEQIEGPEVDLSSDITAQPFFTAPEVDEPTLLRFRLTVTAEDVSADDDDLVDITIEPYPTPIANAGSDQVVSENATVTLDGSNSSDPAGRPLTYSWSISDNITLSDTTATNPVFTAPFVSTITGIEVILTVTNELGDTDTDTAIITVLNE